MRWGTGRACQQDRRELMVNANQVMQMLDGRDEAPYKTFEYIGNLRHSWTPAAAMPTKCA